MVIQNQVQSDEKFQLPDMHAPSWGQTRHMMKSDVWSENNKDYKPSLSADMCLLIQQKSKLVFPYL